MEILINRSDVSEVLSVYGLLILDFLTDRRITKCRFTQQKTELCADGNLRSTVFEFDHPDFPAFLQQCAHITARPEGDRVVLSLNNRDIVTLDWFNFSFVGDSGNFRSADKLQLVQLHLNVFKELLRDVEQRTLFVLFKDNDDEKKKNYLVLTGRNYLDSGGVYEQQSRFYAREFFLVIALQNFQHMIAECLSSGCLNYNLPTDWMPVSAACAAFVTDHPRENWVKLRSTLTHFRADGAGKTMLKPAQAR
jgi:hypothetical protein